MLLILTKTHYVQWRPGEMLTMGRLEIDGEFECWTLQPSSSSIPDTRYELCMSYSERFKRFLPFLLSGNRTRFVDRETPGCILVGRVKGEDFISETRSALGELLAKIEPAMRREKVYLEIRREFK